MLLNARKRFFWAQSAEGVDMDAGDKGCAEVDADAVDRLVEYVREPLKLTLAEVMTFGKSDSEEE